jgi:nicotinamidase-related amidase
MAPIICDASRSVLIVVDMQPSFMKAVPGVDKVLERCKFLVQVARELQVPIVASEQNNTRMGGFEPSLLALLDPDSWPINKMSFSCCGSPEFLRALESTGRRQAVLCGIETHICVNQTALHLLQRGYEVVVAADAIASRGQAAHESAIERILQAGVAKADTESITYEWLGTADHPRFKNVLELVKRYAI